MVLFHTHKLPHLIEKHVTEFSFLDHFRVEPTLEFHHQEQHMIVGSTWEEDLARVELVKGATDGPYVEGRIIRNSKDYLNISFERRLKDEVTQLISGAR